MSAEQKKIRPNNSKKPAISWNFWVQKEIFKPYFYHHPSNKRTWKVQSKDSGVVFSNVPTDGLRVMIFTSNDIIELTDEINFEIYFGKV